MPEEKSLLSIVGYCRELDRTNESYCSLARGRIKENSAARTKVRRIEKVHEGKKLKGQQGLKSVVCTSKRLHQFE